MSYDPVVDTDALRRRAKFTSGEYVVLESWLVIAIANEMDCVRRELAACDPPP